MKKVLFTATVDSHIMQFHLPFLKEFKERGYEVHVATNGDEKIPYCDVKHKVPFERSPLKLKNLRAIKELRKIIEEEKFDIIHCHTPMGSVVTRIAAINARKKLHTRVMYTAHGLHFFKGAPLKNWIIFYPVEWLLSKYTDTLILINKEDYDFCQKRFSKRCKNIEYVPGVGIDEEKFCINMTENEKLHLKTSCGLNGDEFVLACVARLDENKNQGFLLDVVQRLVKNNNKIHLLLIGKDERNEYYQEIVKQKKIENNVHFLGNRDDVPKLLKNVDIILSASKREGLPVNIMEAMVSKIPVVALNCRGMSDLIIDKYNGYLFNSNEYDYETLVTKYCEAINKIYNKDKETINFTQINENIVQNYLIANVLSRMNEIYFKKKRIMHVLHSNSFSGAENVVCTIINNMSDEYDMMYCCPNGPIEDKLKELEVMHVPIKSSSIFELKRVIKKYKPDVIHAHDYMMSFKCAMVASNIKLMSHLHNNAPWIKKLCLKSIVYLLPALKADKIYMVSDAIKDEYIFSKILPDKFENIGNPIDANKILNSISDYTKKYDICCVARLTEAKNPLKFLEVISEIKKYKQDIKAIWVGDGNLRETFEQKVQKLGLADNVEIAGFQSNPYTYVANSKVFLLTSEWEGFGLVAVESLILGVPVFCSGAGGLKNIVRSNVGKICNTVEEYTESILKVLNNNKELDKLSKNCILHVKKFTNLKKYTENLAKGYAEDKKVERYIKLGKNNATVKDKSIKFILHISVILFLIGIFMSLSVNPIRVKYLSMLGIAILVIAAFWKKWKIKLDNIVLILSIIGTIFWGSSLIFRSEYGLKYFVYFIAGEVFYIIASSISGYKDLLIKYLKIFTLVFSILTMLSAIFIDQFSGIYDYLFNEKTAIFVKSLVEGGNGYSGIAGQTGINSWWISIGLIISTIDLICDEKKSMKKFIIEFIHIVALLLCQKRGPVLFDIAVISIILFRSKIITIKNIKKNLLPIGIGLIVMCILVFIIFPNTLQGLISKTLRLAKVGNISNGRTSLYQIGINAWKEKPIFGIGLNNFQFLAEETIGQQIAMHNVILQLIVELGSVFGLVVIYLLIVLYKSIKNIYINNNTKFNKYAYYFTMLFYLTFLTGNILFDSETLYCFYIALVFLESSKMNERKKCKI